MKCPHCQKEIPGKTCPQCEAEVPFESRYCMDCGIEIEEEKVQETDDMPDEKGDGFDLENRILCSDGTCTGIIIKGKCIECGKPFRKSKSKGK